MIISASRRTDIPAFYAEWFMKRIEAGFCNVPNPFNRKQVSRVSLKPNDVDVISFWTRHPRPLFSHLDQLGALGFQYYFQFTVINYPRFLDARGPSLKASIKNFQKLAAKIGPDRVIWRYDPIIFSKDTGSIFHQQNYRQIAEMLNGYTRRSIISFVDIYRKNKKRLEKLEAEVRPVINFSGKPSQSFDDMMHAIVETANSNGMSIESCAEKIELSAFGISPGKCIDDNFIGEQFGIRIGSGKDRGQRELCGCVASRDIGMYHSCRFGCKYCYATSSYDQARYNSKIHQPTSPSLLGWFE